MSSPFIQIFSSSCMKSLLWREGWAGSEFYPCALSSTSPVLVLREEIDRLGACQPQKLAGIETEEMPRRVELEPDGLRAECRLIQEHEGTLKGKARRARSGTKSPTARRRGELPGSRLRAAGTRPTTVRPSHSKARPLNSRPGGGSS